MRRRQFLTAIAGAFTMVAVAGCGAERSEAVETKPLTADERATYEYIVPLGTGVRLDNGEVIELMPQRLKAKVGESMRIINNDDRSYMIGPFYVSAGQQLAMRFTHPGTLQGECLVNPEGEFLIEVAK
ncbi:MAG TPA: hypothetical protein PK020_12025 [Ilumatobacteraceae bacterium]|nr:hypothetical protein [Ilumatobacteraceae bacterium]